MNYLLPAFMTVSVVFAVSAVVTGAKAIMHPVAFSRGFGLPLADAAASNRTATAHDQRSLTMSYISLMGARQLATGMTLLTFAYQNKWNEMAIILAIIGIVVAGTDGFFLSRAGAGMNGRLHAIPGALIAALAVGVIMS